MRLITVDQRRVAESYQPGVVYLALSCMASPVNTSRTPGMAGLGISVLSRHNLRLELAHNHIAVLDVKGFPLFYRWYAVYLKGKKLSLVSPG